jgi:hypothetical protein
MLTFVAAIALAAFAAALVLFALFPAQHALAAHFAFALGVMPLIFAAMTFFVPVLTRTHAANPLVRALPFVALVGGGAAVAGFSIPGWMLTAHMLGACAGLTGALALLGWITWRVHRTVGPAHAGLGWYVAALICLALALGAVLAMSVLPEARADLRRLHLHLNVFGFVALTAVGTLQVLLPTIVQKPDPHAAARLKGDLGWAMSGALAIAAGAAVDARIALVGALLWLVPLSRLAYAWRRYRDELFSAHHAAASLGAALLGLMLLVVAGVLHAAYRLPSLPSVPALLVLYHLPLVTGALSHLLPLWWYAGRSTRREQMLRATLTRYSGLRALLFLAGGVLVLLSARAGFVLALAGLMLFGAQLLRAWAGHRGLADAR